MQEEYYAKKERMDSRLRAEVEQNTIGKDAVKLKRVRFPWADEEEPLVESSQQLDLDLIPGREKSTENFNEKKVDYVRSKEAIKMRIVNKFDGDLLSSDNTKT